MTENSGGGTPPGAADRSAATDRAEASRLPAIAFMLAASVALSRVSGYLRDLVVANQAGAGPEADAYFMAFLLPELLNYLLAGGALTIAFIPLYTRVRERRGEAAAGVLFATVLGSLGLLATVGVVVLELFADSIADARLTGFDPATRALTVRLSRIVLPAQIFFVTGGILRAVLMAHGRFRAQAAAPLIYNGCAIAGGLLAGSVEGFAWGVLVGAGLGNWAYPLFDLRRVRAVRVRIAPFDPRFGEYLLLAAPLMLGISLTTVDQWYEIYFGSFLAVGSVASLSYARKLMMAPVAVVGQAIGAAVLPVLSNLWTRGQRDELNETLLRVLRGTLGLGILLGAATYALAGPAVELLFRHGRFNAEDSAAVAALLQIMSLAIPAWVVQQVAVRAFYAREETWRPMLLGTGIALAVIPLYLELRDAQGLAGLAWAGVIAMTLNAGATLLWARVRFGGLEALPLLATLFRTGCIAAAAALAASLAQSGGEGLEGRAAAALDLAIGGTAFALVSLPLIFAVGDDALRRAFRSWAVRLRQGLLRRKPPA